MIDAAVPLQSPPLTRFRVHLFNGWSFEFEGPITLQMLARAIRLDGYLVLGDMTAVVPVQAIAMLVDRDKMAAVATPGASPTLPPDTRVLN